MDTISVLEIVGFEVLTAIVMKSAIFWDIMPCAQLEVTLLATYFHAGILFGLFLDLEDGGDTFLRNVGWL
jgi:hypothetical protein